MDELIPNVPVNKEQNPSNAIDDVDMVDMTTIGHSDGTDESGASDLIDWFDATE